jgi:signal peptidase II
MRKYHFLIALFVVALDRVTKWTIAHRLSLHDSISVIPGFFRIIHAENPGAGVWHFCGFSFAMEGRPADFRFLSLRW